MVITHCVMCPVCRCHGSCNWQALVQPHSRAPVTSSEKDHDASATYLATLPMFMPRRCSRIQRRDETRRDPGQLRVDGDQHSKRKFGTNWVRCAVCQPTLIAHRRRVRSVHREVQL